MCSPLYLAIHDDFHVTMHFPVGMKPSEAWFKQRNHSTHRLNQYPIYLVSIHETSRGLRAIPGQKHPFLPWYGTGDFGINYPRHTVSAIFQQYRETANCHDMDSKRLHLILWHKLCHTRLKTPIFALVWHTIEDETAP